MKLCASPVVFLAYGIGLFWIKGKSSSLRAYSFSYSKVFNLFEVPISEECITDSY